MEQVITFAKKITKAIFLWNNNRSSKIPRENKKNHPMKNAIRNLPFFLIGGQFGSQAF